MEKKDEKVQIVCVANDLNMFNQVISANANMNKYPVFLYDNSIDNVGISKRYNFYIEQNINSESDFWVVFCHQDFGFNEDPNDFLISLDKNCIYGPIGVKLFCSPKKWLKGIFSNKFGYYPSFKFNVRGLCSKDIKFLTIEKQEQQSGLIKRKLLGQIAQGQGNSSFEKLGKKIKNPKNVETLDCCCLIVHSSLFYKYNLRFDENLDWHMYVEDFCMNARKKYQILSKAVQMDCFHLGQGTLNVDFYSAVKYIKEKYSLKSLKTTCIDD